MNLSQGKTIEYKEKEYVIYKSDFLNFYIYDSHTLELFSISKEYIEDYQATPSAKLPDPEKVKISESIYLEYVTFLSARPVGRPSLGVTKKVSITLPDDIWNLIDSRFDNRSAFFRDLVNKELFKSQIDN